VALLHDFSLVQAVASINGGVQTPVMGFDVLGEIESKREDLRQS
jgi:hypothetical protein